MCISSNEDDSTSWLDYIRVLATCSVIFLHVAANVTGSYPKISPLNWWVANLYESAVRASVPLFVMLTGALAAPQKYDLPIYLRKRLSRILFPFLFWSVVYDLYRHSYEIPPGEIVGLLGYAKWIYATTFQRGAMFHLWYVYMIVGIYLFLPIISPWLRAASERDLLYYLCIWASSLFLSYPILAYFAIKIDLQYFSGYLGYAVLGYFLANKRFGQKQYLGLAIAAFTIGLLSTALGTYYFTKLNNQVTETAYGNLTPNVMLIAASVFYFFKKSSLPPVTGLIKLVHQNSYTIYLAHALVLLTLQRWGIDGFLLMPALGIPLVTTLCLGISVCIAWSLNKSPLGKYVGG